MKLKKKLLKYHWASWICNEIHGVPVSVIKNLTYLQVKDLFSESYMTNADENDTDRQKGPLCSWDGRMNIGKMTILLKAIYRYKVIPIKIPMAFFHRIRTNNFKICMETQKTMSSQNNLAKEEQSWGNCAPRPHYTTKLQAAPDFTPCHCALNHRPTLPLPTVLSAPILALVQILLQ